MRENQNDKINTEVKKKKNAELWLRNGLTKKPQKNKNDYKMKKGSGCVQTSVSDLYPCTNTSLSNRHATLKEQTDFISN